MISAPNINNLIITIKLQKQKKTQNSFSKFLNNCSVNPRTVLCQVILAVKDLANKFSSYFSDKIGKIKTDLENNKTKFSNDKKAIDVDILASTISEMRSFANISEEKLTTISEMRSFANISEEKLSKLILSGNSKSCLLDPMPASFVKGLLPVLLPTIHTI